MAFSQQSGTDAVFKLRNHFKTKLYSYEIELLLNYSRRLSTILIIFISSLSSIFHWTLMFISTILTPLFDVLYHYHSHATLFQLFHTSVLLQIISSFKKKISSIDAVSLLLTKFQLINF